MLLVKNFNISNPKEMQGVYYIKTTLSCLLPLVYRY